MALRFLAAGLAAATLSLPAFSQTLQPDADPAARGFDTASLERLDAQLDALAEAGARPGYAAIIARGGDIVFVSEAGFEDIEAGTPFTVDTPVRIASMSKPVTAIATMQLVDDGAIGLDDPVSDYIPAFGDMQVAVSPMAGPDGAIATRAPATVMTVRHLLTHTAGLGYIFDTETDLGQLYIENSLYAGEGDLAARMEQLAALPLYTDPGERWIYSYANDVLGRVVEVASGMPYEDYLETQIFEPLGMPSTGFFFEDVDFTEAEMSPLYVHAETGELVRFDQPNPDWASGGGGLVSTARDYMRFAMMLANDGELDGVRIIGADTLAMMRLPQTTPEQLGENWQGRAYGFGFDVVLVPENGEQAPGIPGDFSWGGFFDTDFFVSPNTDIAAVIMTQVQPSPNRPEPRTARVFRPLVYRSLALD